MRPKWTNALTTMVFWAKIAVFGGFSELLADGHLDGHTDGHTDGWTHPLTEMRGRIKRQKERHRLYG